MDLIEQIESNPSLKEAEDLILRGLGYDLVPLYHIVKLNYYISALSEQDTTVRDLVKPALRPLFFHIWRNASKEDRYFAIQAYLTFLEKTAEITGLSYAPHNAPGV
jgi:hypothetical protein